MITITVNGETPPDEVSAPPSAVDGQEGETSGRVLELAVLTAVGEPAGLHVTRTQWDVFPWVAAVDAGSPAEAAGLRAGDCLLAAAGRTLLAARVAAVAAAVRRAAAATGRVPLTVWRPDPKHAAGCSDDSVCCGPMPLTLQRLSSAVSGIVSGLECPVCLETVSPPASQCVHGHLLCPRCRPAAADRCPVCRVPMSRGRSLFADHVFRTLADAFQVGPDPAPGALADTIFGRSREPRKKKKKPQREKEAPPTNRLLARLLGKWSSVECLTPSSLSPAQPCPLSKADRLKSLSSSELPTAPSTLTPATSQDSVASEDEEPRRRSAAQLFRCPCERGCPAQLEADAVGAHVRHDHGCVLAQMPDGAAALRLPPWPDEMAVLMHAGRTFYLKVEEAPDALDVWLWLAGGEAECARYEVRASLSGGQGARGRRMSRTISGAELTAPVLVGRALPLAVTAAAAAGDRPSLQLPLAPSATCLQLEVRDLLHEPEVTAT